MSGGTYKWQPPFFLIVDVHGTSPNYDGRQGIDEPECIEIALALVRRQDTAIIDMFSSFIRPTRNQILTKECSYTTGVFQADVQLAPDFALVMSDVNRWIRDNGITSDNALTVVDRRFKVDQYIQSQTARYGLPVPEWTQNTVDIQREFEYDYTFVGNGTISRMLDIAKLRYVTQKGITARDNAFNIALLVMHLVREGHQFKGFVAPKSSSGPSTSTDGNNGLDGGFISFADWRAGQKPGEEKPMSAYLFDPRNATPVRGISLIGSEKPLSSYLLDRSLSDNTSYNRPY